MFAGAIGKPAYLFISLRWLPLAAADTISEYVRPSVHSCYIASVCSSHAAKRLQPERQTRKVMCVAAFPSSDDTTVVHAEVSLEVSSGSWLKPHVYYHRYAEFRFVLMPVVYVILSIWYFLFSRAIYDAHTVCITGQRRSGENLVRDMLLWTGLMQ